MTIRVGVNGAAGRMGRTVCEAVIADPDLVLAGVVDPLHAGLDLRHVAGLTSTDLEIGGGVERFEEAECAVVVDFTTADAARVNLSMIAALGIHAVVGTSGLQASDIDALRDCFGPDSEGGANCIVAPNFAIGAVLMMRFAELAAPFFDSAEIIELHHDQKIDAPSGTAMMTADRMAAASSDWGPDPTSKTVVDGARGGSASGGIPVHSVRLRGIVAHQEVLLGTTGQSLTIRHDSYDRSSFMPGVMMAVKAVADRPGVTLGLDPLLNL